MCLARFLNIGTEFSAHKNIPITSAFVEVRKNLDYNPLTRRMSELAQALSFFKTAVPEGEEDMAGASGVRAAKAPAHPIGYDYLPRE